MKILVDLDGICADLLGAWLQTYNLEWHDRVTIDQITAFEIHEFVKPECGKAIYGMLFRPGFFRRLTPIPGSRAGVAALREAGHDVRFCTAAPCADAAACKLEWLADHFDARPRDVFVGTSKTWVHADVIIDDKPRTLERWPAATGGVSMGIEYPYNQSSRGAPGVALIAPDWKAPDLAWRRIVRAIEGLDR